MSSQYRKLYLKNPCYCLINVFLLLLLLPHFIANAGWVSTSIYKIEVSKIGKPNEASSKFIAWILGKQQKAPSAVAVEHTDTSVNMPLYYYKTSMSELHTFFGKDETKKQVEKDFTDAGYTVTQSSTVYNSEVCKYSDIDTLPNAFAPDAQPIGTMQCPSTTTVDITLDAPVPTDTVRNVLCVTLGMKGRCTDIEMKTPTRAIMKNTDPIFVTVKLRGSLGLPSYFTALFVQELKVNDVIVYTKIPIPGSIISRSACSTQAWFLVYLVLLIPISYIVIKRGYMSGVTRGVKTALETYEGEVALQKQILQQHQHAMYQPVPMVSGDMTPMMPIGGQFPQQGERNYWQEMQDLQYQNYYANQYCRPQGSMTHMTSPMSNGGTLRT